MHILQPLIYMVCSLMVRVLLVRPADRRSLFCAVGTKTLKLHPMPIPFQIPVSQAGFNTSQPLKPFTPCCSSASSIRFRLLLPRPFISVPVRLGNGGGASSSSADGFEPLAAIERRGAGTAGGVTVFVGSEKLFSDVGVPAGDTIFKRLGFFGFTGGGAAFP
jgi:hypothetical protein